MKIAKLLMMTFLATALTGCIFVDDDDDDDGGDVTVSDGMFHLTWVWSGGQSCESTDVDTLSYIFTPDSAPSAFEEYLFTCSEGQGDAEGLALDDYTYVVQALDCSADPTPGCPNGEQRGAPSNAVTATFLDSQGFAVCDEIVGDTCIVDVPTTTLVVTL